MSSPTQGNRPSAMIVYSRKRRSRRTVPAAAMESDASPWASLQEDMLRLIGWRVLAGDLLDYVRFRAVCTNWRSSTVCPRGRGIADPRFHPRRWMMLPEGHGLYPGHSKLRGYIRFFNLSTGVFVRVHLPLFRDHCVLNSVDGVLLLQQDRTTAIRLLHPFTGDIVELPPLATLLPYGRWAPGAADKEVSKWTGLRDVDAAAINVNPDGAVTVMMSLRELQRVAFATSGDQQWRMSRWPFMRPCFFNALSFQGKLYMIKRPFYQDETHHVFQIDAPQQKETSSAGSSWMLPPPKIIAKCPADAYYNHYYLVECNSEILVVTNSIRRHFEVYRLADLVHGRVVPLASIGGNALFLSYYSRSLSVSSKALPTIVGDTIVFFDRIKLYLAQYHIRSDTRSQAADGWPEEDLVPSPCTIIYHIFTCCCRAQWNKGQITGQCRRTARWPVKEKWRVGVSLLLHKCTTCLVSLQM